MAGINLLEVKSKFDAEFRRFSIDPKDVAEYQAFYSLLERVHMLYSIPFVIQYVDPKNADLLPINNNFNYAVALSVSKPLLRILLQRKGESYGELYGYKASKPSLLHKNAASTLRASGGSGKRQRRAISIQNDFHLVSSILDVRTVPATMRRVRLIRTPGKVFGLHIRTGLSHHYTINGYESAPGFFVSRLSEGGIAASTGLLAVNDEIIEVNGIEVFGKTMDQVTDMMVANSSNLIITIRPADQSMCLQPSSFSHSMIPQTPTGVLRASTTPNNEYHSNTHPSLSQMANAHLNSRNETASVSNHTTFSPDNNRNQHEIVVAEDESDEDITAGLITL